MNRKLKVFVAVVFALVALWWAVYVPYAPDRIYRAIPANASFVSSHHDLAGRWKAITTNPITLSILHATGISQDLLDSIDNDPSSRAWLKRLASDKAAIAFVPSLGLYGDTAWVFSSWIGGQSQRLRLLLKWADVPGLVEKKAADGSPYWIVEGADLEPGLTLAITLVEGVVLGCIAEREEAIDELLATYNGKAPSVASMRLFDFDSDREHVTDRGWLSPAAIGRSLREVVRGVTFEFSDVKPQGLVGHLEAELNLAPRTSDLTPGEVSGLGRLFGDLPMMLASSRLETIGTHLDSNWTRILEPIITADVPGDVALAVLGKDYGGRIFGIRVPNAVLVIKSKDGADLLDRCDQVIDRLNAEYQFGLIRREYNHDEHTVHVLEGTSQNAYARLPTGERPAFAFCGEWLVFSSTRDGLVKLLERYNAPDGIIEEKTGRWYMASRQFADDLFIWTDLEQGGKTFRQAAGLYAIKMGFDTSPSALKAKRQIRRAKAWSTALEPFSEVRAGISHKDESAVLRFDIGEEGSSS